MAELRHIERIFDVWNVVKPELDPMQIAIVNGQAERSQGHNNSFVWSNATGGVFVGACQYAVPQSGTDGPVFQNNEFGAITTHDTLYVDEYIRKNSGNGAYIQFISNSFMRLAVANSALIELIDDGLFRDVRFNPLQDAFRLFVSGQTTNNAFAVQENSTGVKASIGGIASALTTDATLILYHNTTNTSMITYLLDLWQQSDTVAGFGSGVGMRFYGRSPLGVTRSQMGDLHFRWMDDGSVSSQRCQAVLQCRTSGGSMADMMTWDTFETTGWDYQCLVYTNMRFTNENKRLEIAKIRPTATTTTLTLYNYQETAGLLVDGDTGALTLIDSGTTATDIFSSGGQIIDYSSTTVLEGWSTTDVVFVQARRVGRTVYVWFNILGTSNGSTATISVPFASDHGGGVSGTCVVQRSGGTSDVGSLSMNPGSNIVAFGLIAATGSAGGWDTGNTKAVRGCFTYYTASNS